MKPSYVDYLAVSQRLAPGVAEEDIRKHYQQAYGEIEPPAHGPTWEQYRDAASALAPGVDEASVRERYDTLYNLSLGQAVKRGVKSSFTHLFAPGVNETLGYVADKLGADGLAGRFRDYAEYWRETGKDHGPPPSLQGNVVDNPSMLRDPNFYAYYLSQQLPLLATGTGAYGAAAKGATALGAGIKGSRIAGAVGGGAMGASTEAGGVMGEARARGFSPEEQNQVFERAFVGGAALNAIPFVKAFGPGSLGKRALGTAVAEAVTEGSEEVLQGQILGDPLSESLKQAATVAPIAALAGGPLAFMGGTGNRPAAGDVSRDAFPQDVKIRRTQPNPPPPPQEQPLPPSDLDRAFGGQPAPAPTPSGSRTAPTPNNSGAGRLSRVRTATGTEVDTAFDLVEADAPITSHDPALNPNPAFPAELQPRDRSRSASELQVNRIAQGLDPELLGESRQASLGAPILGEDNVVESGNGRIVALNRAYRGLPQQAKRYRDWLATNAERFGLDASRIEGMRAPVLVRRRTTPLDAEGRVKFARDANRSELAGLSGAEQAQADARIISDDMLSLFQPDENANVLAASNRDFLTQFARHLGNLEAGGLVTAEGQWSRQMAERVTDAIFARAYNEPRLIAARVEESDPDFKNVLSALTVAAPEFAKARGIDPAFAGGNLDIPKQVTAAVELMRGARLRGTRVESLLAQQDAFNPLPPDVVRLAQFFEANKRRPRQMGEALKELGRYLQSELRNQAQPGLLGGQPAGSKDVMDAANRELEGQGQGVRFSRADIESTVIEGAPFKTPLDAFNALRKPLAGKTVTGTRSGLAINISSNALRHSIFHKYTPESGMAHRELESLLKRAIIGETHAPTKPGDRHSLRAVHRLYAPAWINGSLYRVKLTVKSFLDQNRGEGYYDLEAVEIEKPADLPGDDIARDATPPPESTGRSISIADLLRDATRDSDGKPFVPDARKSVTPAPGGLRASALAQTLQRATRDWKGAPPIHVVQSIAELPAHIQEDIRASGANGAIDGVFDPQTNRVYLVADRLSSEHQALSTLLHEVVGHYGLRQLFGSEFDSFLDQVWMLYGKGGLAEIAERYGLDLSNREQRRVAAEEKLAHLAALDEKPKFLEKVIAWFKQWLRKQGFPGAWINNLSESEVRVILSNASRLVREAPGQSYLDRGQARFDVQERPPAQSAFWNESPEVGGAADPDGRYAGSINLDRLNTDADVIAAIHVIYRDNRALIDQQRRTPQPWSETERLAGIVGMTPKELLKRKRGQAFNAEEIEAARSLMIQSAEDLVAKAEKAKSGDAQALLDLQAARLRHTLIQAQYSGVASEAGRALNILRKRSALVQNVNDALQLLDEAGGAERLTNLADMIGQFETVGQVTKFARESWNAKWHDVALEIWINWLLSGPQTHATNMLSNTLVQAITGVEHLVAAGIGKLHGGDKVALREVQSYVLGALQGAREGLKLAWRSFSTEEEFGTQKVEGRLKSISAEALNLKAGTRAAKAADFVGRQVRIPGRALMGEDAFFKSIGYRAALHRLATRQALSEGLSGARLNNRIKELIAAPPKTLEAEALHNANYVTFTNRLGTIGLKVQGLVNSNPFFRVLMPFVRTPTNIAKFAIERSPFGFLFKEVRENIKAGGARRDLQLARIAFGSSVAALVAYYALQGLITGGGPEDPKERALWYEQGFQPYSVKVGDQWVSFARMEPFGMIAGISADAVAIWDKMSQEEQGNVAAMMIGAIAKNLTSKTFVRGLAEFIEVLQDPDRYAEGWAQKLAGTVIPTGVAQVARVMDPTLREARTTLDKIKSRIPGMSEELLPRLSIWGEPIRLEGGIGPDLLSPIYVSQVRNDPVTKELAALEIYPSQPSRKLRGVEIPPPVHHQYVKEAGQLSHKLLSRVIAAPGYARLPDVTKKDLIEDVLRDVRRDVRNRILATTPALREAIRTEMLRERTFTRQQ